MKLKELLGQIFPNNPHLTDHIDPELEATHADFRAVASVKALISRSRINKSTKLKVVSTKEEDDNSPNGRWTKVYHVIISCISNGGDWSMRSISCRIPMTISIDGYDDVHISATPYEADPSKNGEAYVSMDDEYRELTIRFDYDMDAPLFFATGQKDDDPMQLPTHGNWLQKTLGYALVEQWLEWNGVKTLIESVPN